MKLVEIISEVETGRQFNCRPVLIDQLGRCVLHNMSTYQSILEDFCELDSGKLVNFMPGLLVSHEPLAISPHRKSYRPLLCQAV